MNKNTAMYNFAKSFLGKGGATFRSYCGLPSGAAWCNAFVTYIFHKSGNAPLYCNGKKQTYCPTSIKICRKEMAEIPMYLAMPSDVIYFDWDRNGVPNHIGFVRAHNTTDSIYTIEGNTSNKVMNKTRPAKYVCGIFRPHFKANFTLKKLTVDGDCGYNTIANFQVLLKKKGYYNGAIDGILGLVTVKAIQRFVGLTGKDVDGAWGPKTSRKLQKVISTAQDGEFGKNSVIALQKYINAKLYPAKETTTTTTPTATKHSYRIDVDLTNQIATIYNNGKAIMSEFVSTARKGKTTPVGNWKIQGASGGRKAKYRTAKLSGGKSYAEFLCRFTVAKCMHTVPYSKRQTSGYVNKNEFNKLGTPRSAGCVRMPYKMAKYIYNNCPIGTPVKVFRGTAGSYPMGKPTKYTATSNVDPTK